MKNTLYTYLPQRSITRLARRLAHCNIRWWKNFSIRTFIKRYKVDLSPALLQNIDDYPNLNSFFTRLLKPESRPIAQGTNEIASPVDGSISQIGKIREDTLVQAKGFYYNLNALLGGSETHAKAFRNGAFVTLYLSPKDYHRVHMPLTGQLTETIYIPGSLFSVNPKTAQIVPQLFARNERLVCLFDCGPTKMAVILVGAMIVSGIKTVWPLTLGGKAIDKKIYTPNIELAKGAELGHFQIGSTVIVLFQNNSMTWQDSLQEGSTIQMGQCIGNLIGGQA